jgi:quinol monooxygenase YgiN
MKIFLNNRHLKESTRRWLQLLSGLSLVLSWSGSLSAQEQGKVIRLARLQIDSTRLVNYQVALKEEIEASLRTEPGVLTLYAVAEKGNPTKLTIFEIYANEEAYTAHRNSPHFKKYKLVTKEMVKSLELSEAVPIILGSK